MINFYDLAVMEEADRDVFWGAELYFIIVSSGWLEKDMEIIFISLFYNIVTQLCILYIG